jgi:cytochrome c553
MDRRSVWAVMPWVIWGAWIVEGSAAAPAELMDALQARGDPRRGAALFETCAACHGADGGGVADGTVPAIAGQPAQVIAKQLVDFRRERRRDLRMEHFADERHLETPQDVADVAAHVAQLTSSTAPGTGDGTGLGDGAALYRARCAGCHGEAALADGARMLPGLAGQHAAYTLRQLREAAAGQRPNMQGAHGRLLGGLGPREYASVADYLSRLGRGGSPSR